MIDKSTTPPCAAADADAIAMAQTRIDAEDLATAVGELAGTPMADADLTALIATLENLGRLGRTCPRRETATARSPLKLGRFHVHEELGRGGFGIVVRADDPDLQRTVALKVPLPERLLADQPLDDYVREAKIAAQLEHAGIVRIYEAGWLGPIWYIAAEYCSGPTLAQWLNGHPQRISPRLAAELIIQIAAAVHYAHTRGVLHLDLKPANILMEPGPPTSSPARPMITDFGLASRLETTGLDDRQRIAGTLVYMAPEQVLGNSARIGVCCDVFALGALLYDLLHSLPAVDISQPRPTPQELLNFTQSLRPPSALVPRDLDAICQKCLQSEPQDRYASAQDLALDLQRYLAGQPVTARPINWAARRAYAIRRRPLVAALLSLLTLTTLASAVFILYAWRRAETNLVALQTEQARHVETANRLDSSLLNLTWLIQESQLQPKPARESTDEELNLLHDFYREITTWTQHTSTGVPHEAILAAGHSLGMLEAIRAADRQRLDAEFQDGLAAWRTVHALAPQESKWRRAMALHVLFYCQKSPFVGMLWWRHPEVGGPALDSEVVALIEEPFALLSIELAKKLKRASDRERAQAALQNAILLLEERRQLPDPQLTRSYALLVAYNELTDVAYQVHADSDYVQVLDKATTLAESIGSEATNSPRLAEAIGETYRLHGSVSFRQRDPRATLRWNLQAIEFTKRAAEALPEDTYVRFKLADLRERTGNLYVSQGEHQLAVAMYHDALEELNQGIARHAKHRTLIYHRLAVLRALAAELLRSADYSSAESKLKEAITEYEQTPLGNQDSRTRWKDIIACYQMLGRIYADQEHAAEAIAAYTKSQTLLDQAKARYGSRQDFLDLTARNRRELAAIQSRSATKPQTVPAIAQ